MRSIIRDVDLLNDITEEEESFGGETNQYQDNVRKRRRKLTQLEILAKQRESAIALCNHVSDKGKSKIEYVSETFVRCKKCETEFDTKIYSMHDVNAALQILTDITNQLQMVDKDFPVDPRIKVDLKTITEIYNDVFDTEEVDHEDEMEAEERIRLIKWAASGNSIED